MNQFRQKCIYHGKDVGLFCTKCLSFICTMCEDAHYQEGSVIPAYQIIKRSKAFNYVDKIKAQQKQQLSLYQQALAAIKTLYELATADIENKLLSSPQYAFTNELRGTRLSKEAIQLIKTTTQSLEENDKLSDYVQSITKLFEEIISIAKNKAKLNHTIDFVEPISKPHDDIPLLQLNQTIDINVDTPRREFEDYSRNACLAATVSHGTRSSSAYKYSLMSYRSPDNRTYVKNNIKPLYIHKEEPLSARYDDDMTSIIKHESSILTVSPSKANDLLNVEIKKLLPINSSEINNSVTIVQEVPITTNESPNKSQVNANLSQIEEYKELTKPNIFINEASLVENVDDNAVTTILPYFKSTKSKTLILFNTMSRTAVPRTLDREINEYSETIAVGEKIFIIGGLKSVAIEDVYEADIKLLKLIPKQKLPLSKYEHTLCYCKSFIYCIGGLNISKKKLSNCEKYSIQENKWYELPKLISPRSWAAAFVVNATNLYAVFGMGRQELGSIEMLCLKGTKRWEMTSPNFSCKMFSGYSLNGIQIEENTALLFGGITSNSIVSKSSYKFVCDGLKVSIIQCSDMKSPCTFSESTAPIFVNGCVYVVDQKRNLHIFDTKSENWDLLEYDYYKK